ncbi:MAG: hypothetical protein V4773_26835, partial [Verrucomicrobiota bacterium]
AFMDDIGATTANDLLVYATGAEVGGINGNFSAADVDTSFASAEGARSSPQTATRVRGLTSASTTRGYFLTDIPFDGHNTGQVTVNRGPNAVLFGLGSPAGVIDHSLDQASFKNLSRATFRFGKENSSRSTLDVNRELIRGKLAIRAIGLYQDNRFQQRPAFEQDRRTYGALLFRPFKDTTLRVNTEAGRIHASRPNPFLPLDNITPWMEAGRPIYDFAALDRDTRLTAGSSATLPFVTRGPSISPQDSIYSYYSDANAAVPSYSGRTQVGSTQQRGVSAINVDGQAETYTFLGTKNAFDIDSSQRFQSFNPANASIFDWRHRLIEGTTAYHNSGFHTANIAFSQSAWRDRIGFELVADRQKYVRINYQPYANRVGSNVFVDVNTTLANGQSNLNVGRPFIYTGAVNQTRLRRVREDFRATGFAKLDVSDLNKSLGRWLGHHTLTGLGERQRIETMNTSEKLALNGPGQDALFGVPIRPQSRQINRIVYIGPSLIGSHVSSTADARLQSINVPIWTPGLQIPVEYFDPATQTLRTETQTVEAILNAGSTSREKISSSAAIFQSYWLSNHIVTIAGWREDKSRLYTNSSPPQIPGDPALRFTYDGFEPPSVPTNISQGRLKSYSIVAKAPKPLLRRFGGAPEASIFYNDSQNFSTSGGRVDYLGKALPPPEGKTREYGINLTLLNQRFILRWNRFETRAANASYSNLIGIATGTLLFTVAEAWEADRNNGIDRSAEIARLFQGVPAEMKEIFNHVVTTDANGRVSATHRNPTGLTDTADSVAKGHEIELVFNVTRSWRTALNIARQNTVLSNISPVTERWLKIFGPNLEALKDSPFGSALNVDRSNPSSYLTLGERMYSQFTAPYKTLNAQEGTQALEQRKWRVNFVTNYTFREAWLKGWSVGTGVRWQDKAGIGYIILPQPDGSSSIDVNNPVMKPDQWNLDAWLGYERPLRRGITWRVQLNVKNIVADTSFQPLVIHPKDGTVAQYGLPNARDWYITNTFSF